MKGYQSAVGSPLPHSIVSDRSRVGQLTALFAISLVLVCFTTYLAYITHDSLLGVDDAQIAFVYASHLAAGNGLVYNIGGEHVEGFTSLLWVLIAAVLFRVSSSPEPYLLAVMVLMGAATYATGARLAARSFHLQLLYIVGILAWPAQVVWQTTSLMDTGLWGLELTIASVLTARPGIRRVDALIYGGLMIALVMTRPESLLLCPIFLLLRAGRILSLAGSRVAGRETLLPAALFCTAGMGLTLFRLWYFGYPFPNTYYAKVSELSWLRLRDGLGYLRSYVMAGPLVTVTASIAGSAALWSAGRLLTRGRDRLRDRLSGLLQRESAVLAWLSLALLGTPVWNGGDHFAWWRMYQPSYPILLACLFSVVREIAGQRWPRGRELPGQLRFAAGVAVGAAMVLYGYGPSSWLRMGDHPPVAQEFRIARNGMDGGIVLHGLFTSLGPLPSVGVVTAGGVKRTYSGEVVDLMGLNNTLMAHTPGDRHGVKNHAAFSEDVFFQQAPDIVWPFPMPFEAADGAPNPAPPFPWAVLRDLPQQARFQRQYRFAIVCRADAPRLCIPAYFRSDLMARLASDEFFRLR